MWKNKRKKIPRRRQGQEDDLRDSVSLNVNTRVAKGGATKGHRTAVIVLVCVVAAGIAAAGWFALRTLGELMFSKNPRYAITALDIRSDGKNITPELIKEWTKLRTGMNLFEVDIAYLRNYLLKYAPMIRTLEISRKLPGTLEINLTERLPIAKVNRRFATPLGVDRDGCTFGLKAAGQTLPLIIGYNGGPVQPGQPLKGPALKAIEVLDICNKTSIGKAIKIAAIDVTANDSLTMHLAGGEVVRLAWQAPGQTMAASRHDIEQKLRTLIMTMDKSSERGKRIARVDLTFGSEYIPAQEY